MWDSVAPQSMEFFRQKYWGGVAISYSRGSSQPRDWTHISCVSCIGRWILYHCATWETHWSMSPSEKSIFLTVKCLRFRSGVLLRHNLVYQVMLHKSWKLCTKQTFLKRSFYFPITFMRTLCVAYPSAHPSPCSWGENKCRKNEQLRRGERETYLTIKAGLFPMQQNAVGAFVFSSLHLMVHQRLDTLRKRLLRVPFGNCIMGAGSLFSLSNQCEIADCGFHKQKHRHLITWTHTDPKEELIINDAVVRLNFN